MKEPLRQQLEYGLQQMGLHYPVIMQQKLVHYIQLIARWNKVFNLTAIRNVEDMVSKHLLDSLAVQPFIEGSFILDVGSGAGLPGIPIAITSPEKQFVLVDSNGKKTRFLTQAKIDLELENVEIVQQRIQDYRPLQDGHRIYFDVITARAYASTVDILHSTAHLQKKGTRTLVMQGKLDEYLPDIEDGQDYQLVEALALDVYGLAAQRHLLEIERIV